MDTTDAAELQIGDLGFDMFWGDRVKSSAWAPDRITVIRSGSFTPGKNGERATSPQASINTMPNAGDYDCGQVYEMA